MMEIKSARTARWARGVAAAWTLCVAGFWAAGCSSSDPAAPTVPPEVPVVSFERHRDGTTGQGVPILTERGSGFDAREVDSAAILHDSGRAGGDVFMLYYEATAADVSSTLGLVTSATSDLAVHVIDRAQVLGLGAPGSGYEGGVTDPTVIVDAAGTGPRYRMWFEGRDAAAASTIFTAVSDDGVGWRQVQRCQGLAASFAVQRIADPSVIHDGTIYRMVFEAVGGTTGLSSVGYAESDDGLNWTVRDASGAAAMAAGPVLAARGGLVFDGAGVGAPCLVLDATAPADSPWRWQLWYEAADQVQSTQSTLGVAVSTDGLHWERFDGPALEPASDSIVPLPFDSGDLEHPAVWIDPTKNDTVSGHFLLYYTGDGEANVTGNRIGLARGELVDVGVGAN